MELGKIVKVEYVYLNLVGGKKPHRERIVLDCDKLEITKQHINNETDTHIYNLKDSKLIEMVNEIGVNEEPFINEINTYKYGDIGSFELNITYQNGNKFYKGEFEDDVPKSFVKILGRLREYLRFKAFSINFAGLEQVLNYKDDYLDFKRVTLIDLESNKLTKQHNTRNLDVKFGDIVKYLDDNGKVRQGRVNFVFEQNKKDFCAYLTRSNPWLLDK